jgi:hypothetical protein
MKKNVKVIVRGAIPNSADERPVYLTAYHVTSSLTWTYERRLATPFDTQDEAIAACRNALILGVAVSLEYIDGEEVSR